MGIKKKTQDNKIEMAFFERSRKIFDTQSGIDHLIFQNVLETQQVNETTPQGIRLLVARYPDFYKLYLYRYVKVGQPGFPRGGVVVWNATHEQMQNFYFESVALHPEGGYRKFYEE